MRAWSYLNQPLHLSSHKQFPTDGANCRVTIFRESLTTVNVDVRDDWVGTRNTKLDGLLIQGDELTIWGCEFLSGLIKQSMRGDVSLSFSLRSPLPCGCYLHYIVFLDHLGPTLVSHPCLYLSARLISHSFWHFASYGDPDSTVQGSCSHKWGQDVSYEYLMRRWQFIL